MSIHMTPPNDPTQWSIPESAWHVERTEPDSHPYRGLLMRLRGEGFTKIVGNFEGSGDDGGLSQVYYFQNHLAVVEHPFSNEVDAMLYVHMSRAGSDFNNDGCFGTITVNINVLDFNCHVVLETRYCETNRTEEIYEL